MPHNGWWPRPHQIELWNYLVNEGGKRAMAVWHRRAGKDEVCLHATALAMIRRPGNYWHCLPEYAQSRKAIWDSVNPHTGKRRIDEAFPEVLRSSTRDHDMTIKFHNGSTWSCIGADSYDRVVGSSAAGVVFSEFALSNPSAWAYMRPMLEENDGWAVSHYHAAEAATTHSGNGHEHAARRAPGWFYELQTARDTEALTKKISFRRGAGRVSCAVRLRAGRAARYSARNISATGRARLPARLFTLFRFHGCGAQRGAASSSAGEPIRERVCASCLGSRRQRRYLDLVVSGAAIRPAADPRPLLSASGQGARTFSR